MLTHITPHLLAGQVMAPPSKSYGHRYLIASYLAGGSVTVLHAGQSADIAATICALSGAGLSVTQQGDSYTVCRNGFPSSAILYCGESGSTLRFLMPVMAALGMDATFDCEQGLRRRPIADLSAVLQAHGAKVEGYTLHGHLVAGDYSLGHSVSSQYVSGLMFALPLLDGDSRILFDSCPSRPYLDITVDVLLRFGVAITPIDGGYYVKGNQTYVAPHQVSVEGDYSGAAFYLAAAALGHPLSLAGLNPNTKQGDSAILAILQSFGADVQWRQNEVYVQAKSLHGATVDIDDCPDLAQVVAVLAACSEGQSVLRHVGRLRIKESDRLLAIQTMLDTAKVPCFVQDDNLYIKGAHPMGGAFVGGNDHRTVMSAAILASVALGDSSITDSQAVAKSYPAFWQEYTKLGGQIHVDMER